jgi:transcriptional regulator with PAS, ATPase and Fis domain
MIESVKRKLWEYLSKRRALLVMLFNSKGEILWHKGRSIVGKNVAVGDGFSRTHISKSLKIRGTLREENIVVSSQHKDLPHSAKILNIKSLLIQPIDNEMFLYVDSGSIDHFSDPEIEVIKMMGNLLSQVFKNIRNQESQADGICGASEAIEKVKSLVLKYSVEEDPIFILGENGSGKSHIARLIHKFSGREGPFIIVNTPALPETLLENEIFGYQQGAHSEAGKDKPGLVELADQGTLFFDEIAEMPVKLQSKLLQFIETRTFRRLGDLKERKVNVRILAATNKDIGQQIKNKCFRKDLFYRLNVLPLKIPPLRNRIEDLPALVELFREYLKGKTLTDEFWKCVRNYEWPGNVRELKSVIKRAGLLIDEDEIGVQIKEVIQGVGMLDEPLENSDLTVAAKEVEGGRSFFDTVWSLFLNRDISRREVKSYLRQVYRENDHSLKRTAAFLNIKDKYGLFVKNLHHYKIHPKN